MFQLFRLVAQILRFLEVSRFIFLSFGSKKVCRLLWVAHATNFQQLLPLLCSLHYFLPYSYVYVNVSRICSNCLLSLMLRHNNQIPAIWLLRLWGIYVSFWICRQVSNTLDHHHDGFRYVLTSLCLSLYCPKSLLKFQLLFFIPFWSVAFCAIFIRRHVLYFS